MVDENSIKAFIELRDSGILNDRSIYIYEFILRCPDLTARELTKMMGKEDPNYIRPRITELVDMGLIESNGKRQCSITNKTVYVWKVITDFDLNKLGGNE